MMSFNELKAVCSTRVAGPQSETSSKNVGLHSTTVTHTPPLLNASSMFPFITETYRELQSYISGLRTDFQLIQTINKYKKGCNEVYTKVLESYNMCYQLAQNIARTMDIFKELCTCLPDLEEYSYRLCEIMSIFVACELRLSADAAQQDQLLIAQRIIYVMRRHLVQEEEQETSHNILRTLVYIPKLFNARDIMCAIFGEFIPLKPVPEVNVLPDKLYMLYIIVFYRWMMMQNDEDDKVLIVNFAESFMKPSVSLCSNNLYGSYLPMYAKHSTATRTILNNLKYYGDIRNACIIDNALKQTGAVVNLCDDEEDDIIFVDTYYTTDFAEVFASIRLQPLNAGISNIKISTTEEESLSRISVNEVHDKWLNDFQKLANQHRESQLLLEKQQNKQVILNGEKESIICLDSDSEEESEAISSADDKKRSAETANRENNVEDLFADNYPLTNTPLSNCVSDLESLDADDENDTTKISPRFLSSNLRTYQSKKSNLLKSDDQNKPSATEQDKLLEIGKAYRRDSIHISSTPPEGEQDDEDEGTDVQDENDDLLEEVDETHAYTFLLTNNKRSERKYFPKQIQTMALYPAYNSMHNEKFEFSQNVARYSQHHHYQQNQNYHSDNSEMKTPNKQKKKVQFNINLLGPTIVSSEPQKTPLKPALQQTKYKASDAKDNYHLRGFERFRCARSTDDSVSTVSSNKQQDHLEAAASFFRQAYSGPISPSLSSASSRSGTALDKSSTLQKTTRFAKSKTPASSIIQNREALNAEYHSMGVPGTSCNGESSDDYSGVASDSGIIINQRYRNDSKLRKRCAVVITSSKEVLQYQRDQIREYNEILQQQRRHLERKTIEKLKEKERRRAGGREEKVEKTIFDIKEASTVVNDQAVRTRRRAKTYQESFMSSESEHEVTFQVRTRRQKRENSKDLQSLNIHTESSTATLLNQIDAHLDTPGSTKIYSSEIKDCSQEKQAINSGSSQQTCDINSDKSQIKMSELNLLADIAQHLSPYQLDYPENNSPRSRSSTSELSSITKAPPHDASFVNAPKEKVIVTEQLFIQSIDSFLVNKKPQLNNDYPTQQKLQVLSSCAHEPKLNAIAILKSSPCENLMQNENQQTDCQSENNDNQRKEQTDDTLEQILEESISALAVNRPYNTANEPQILQCEPTIPILISNVESLNQHVQSDIAKQKSEDKVYFDVKNSIKSDSDNLVLAEKEDNNYNNKEIVEVDNVIKTTITGLSSHILNHSESSVLSATEAANISSISASDLSNISLESEISKHLPETAEPSPVVTDISDNSNESHVSKNFERQFSNINNSTTSIETNNEISLLDLSLVMPNIIQSTTTCQQESLETNFNQFNSNLNTPIKGSAEISRETELAKRSTNDLNTPLKFAMQSELEINTTPLKSGLETDNNVTKFLDLILNKTVTEAESETRDKIIKELNALTADPVVASEVGENTLTDNEIQKLESDLKNEQNKLIDFEQHIEINKCMKKEIDLKQQNILLDKTSECNSHIRKEKNSLRLDKSKLKALPAQYQLRTQSANNDLNPPNLNLQEDHKELLCDMKTTALSGTFPFNSLSPPSKTKAVAIKQTFNKKCRVRLKRLNMDAHCTITKTEPIPPATLINSPIELQNANNDITKYDSVKEKSSTKKACLKTSNKYASKELDKTTENVFGAAIAPELTPTKKPKLDAEKLVPADMIETAIFQKPELQSTTQTSKASDALINNNTITITKPKQKTSKTVTFDLSNLNEELRENTMASNHKHKSKSHAACFLKSSRTSRKLPDNTLRAAETLQLFVNTINARTRSPPPAEFNKKRSPIKNKCIAEDETPRPPPTASLMGTPPCKKSCREKSRSHLTSKCKDQLVSSLTNASTPSITSDITTARIYTSSPLDQTLPEYDDNVDTVADSELILPPTTGSLRRKLKRPKKSLLRPEPADDVCSDDIANPSDCNRDDDTDAVAEELLPIPSANEHMLEEIVSARPTHIGASTVIRDEYMNIEATATVPVYLFNDESRDLGSPEVNQSSDYTNVVDSSSYLQTATATAPSNLVPTPASATSTVGNLQKSMLSPSEHEVSSTQETFYQNPTKIKQTEIFGEKSSTSKEKGNSSSSGSTTNTILKQKPDEDTLKNNEDYKTSSTVGLLQNNQVDTTNHSPEMCNLALTATKTNTPTLSNNRKIRKASTHDEILFNELQHQLPSTKRKPNKTSFRVESTSGN